MAWNSMEQKKWHIMVSHTKSYKELHAALKMDFKATLRNI